MITQRAFLVGILGFCLYLIAFVNVLPSFYLLTWLAVGILFSSLGIALLSLVGLSCEWRVAQARVLESLEETVTSARDEIAVNSDGDAASETALVGPLLELGLANAGTLNKINVLLEVRLEALTRDESLTRRFLIEALPSGASLTALLPLSHLPRGRYRVAQLRLIGSDVLGLFRIQKRVTQFRQSNTTAGHSPLLIEPDNGTEPELIVGPAMVSLKDAGIAYGSGEEIGNLGTTRLLGQSDELRGTRPYAAGDDLRRVHWRSTARHGHLIVKEFHHAAKSQALIVWDGAAGTNWGEDNATSVEYGLRLVASLCRALGEAGRSYALLRLDSSPLLISSADQSGAASVSLIRIIDALADADAERQESLSQAMGGFLSHLRTVDEVFLITASTVSDIQQVAGHWQGRGARVLVGLINGAAFLKQKGAKSSASKRLHRQPLDIQHRKRDGLPSADAYMAQQQGLQENGVQVALLSPAPEELGSNSIAPLRPALHTLLERQPSGYRSRVASGVG